MTNSAVIIKNKRIVINETYEVKKEVRITYIDTAKAIAIFLTILSHSGLSRSNPIEQFIFSFHMPLFFLIAGWTQKNRKLTSVKEWKNFILKKVYTLIVPYLIYTLIYSKGVDLTVYKYILYGTMRSLVRVDSIGAMWFLPCMFSSSIIYQIIINIKSNIKNKYLKNGIFISILIMCGIISSYFNYYKIPEIGIPLSLNIALSGVLFMFVGNYVYKLYCISIEKFNFAKNKLIILLIGISFLLIGSFTYKLNFEGFAFEKYDLGVSMGDAWYGNYFVFLMNAIISSIGIILISMIIDNKILRFFGQNTIIILYFHIQALYLNKTYIIKNIPDGTYKFFINSILSFLEVGLIIPIINKFFPILAGKNYQIKEK